MMTTTRQHKKAHAELSRYGFAFVLALAACIPTRGLANTASTMFDICVDYHCDRAQGVVLSDDDWATISGLLYKSPNPQEERQNIRRAVGWLERHTGLQAGTWRDKPKNAGDSMESGQLDCIAESKNTTRYLQLLQQAGLLRWHTVEARKKRQRWIFAIHWTAVIREVDNGKAYAVDSWYGANGEPPIVQPLEDWLREAPSQL